MKRVPNVSVVVLGSVATLAGLLSGCSDHVLMTDPATPWDSPGHLRRALSSPAQGNEPVLHAQLWSPVGFPTPPDRIPLIVFLHGRGESGTDGLKQTTVGLGPWAEKHPEWFPAAILMPQKPDEKSLWPEYQAQVLGLIDEVVRASGQLTSGRPIDPDRIILTGLSQGGHGTWHLLKSRPDLFAAAAPICGWGTDRTYAGGQGFGALGSVPIWAFHGEQDDIVPPASSRGLVDAVRSARAPQGATGGQYNVKLTLFPQANHNSWDPAYGDKALADWMMLQVRQR